MGISREAQENLPSGRISPAGPRRGGGRGTKRRKDVRSSFLLKSMRNDWFCVCLSLNYLFPLCQMISHGAPYDPSPDHDGVGLIDPALGQAVGTAVEL